MAENGPRENSGILFVNDYRGNNPKAPQFRGSALVGGAYWAVAAWSRTSKTGKKFLTLAYTPAAEAEAKREAARTAAAGKPPRNDDSDLPF